jgi:hypothetical protein
MDVQDCSRRPLLPSGFRRNQAKQDPARLLQPEALISYRIGFMEWLDTPSTVCYTLRASNRLIYQLLTAYLLLAVDIARQTISWQPPRSTGSAGR